LWTSLKYSNTNTKLPETLNQSRCCLRRGLGWVYGTNRVLDVIQIPCEGVIFTGKPPFHQIDIIGAMVIVWRVRGKIIRSVLCNIVSNNNVHSAMQTHVNRPSSSLDWVLSHWGHFTVLRFIFVYVLFFCITVYCMHNLCVAL